MITITGTGDHDARNWRSQSAESAFTAENIFWVPSEARRSSIQAPRPSTSLRSIRLSVPPTELIERFSDVTQNLDVRRLSCEQESRTLAQLRETLLPKLISGEVRLPEAEDAIEEAV